MVQGRHKHVVGYLREFLFRGWAGLARSRRCRAVKQPPAAGRLFAEAASLLNWMSRNDLDIKPSIC
jgi:hypothetical protein